MPETWGDYFARRIPEYENETRGLAAREDEAARRRFGLMETTFNELPDGGYWTDADTNRMYGEAADQASKARMAAFRSLRQNLGGRGITGGGYASGLGARIEMDFLGKLANQARTVKQFQKSFNAEQAQRRLQGAGAVASSIADPSDAAAQGMTNVLGLQLTREGLEREDVRAQLAANAAKDAGKKQFLGGLAQGFLGLAGAAF